MHAQGEGSIDIDQDWLHAVSDAEEAAGLTADLVARRSYPGEEADVQQFVLEWLGKNGLESEIVPTPGHADRPNIVARIQNGAGPTVLLNGHVDTVLAADGWDHDPWVAQRSGDRLSGLGACDMKSGVAAAMLATRALASRRDLWQGTLVFSSVVDEEAYSLGARALIESGISADAVIVTESCWRAPCLGAFGKMLVRADVTGRSAHASWPVEGANAVVEAARFIARLEEAPLPQHSQLQASECVLSINGGNQQYVMTVPEHASILINRHTVPGETVESVLNGLRSIVDDMGSAASFEFSVEPPFYPPWQIGTDDPLVERFTRAYSAEAGHEPAFAYNGFGDANLFSGQSGIPTIQFGPHGEGFHQANEWVSVTSIAATVRVLLRLAVDIMPPSPA
jgi:acetylornithine deacetylase/succinyl-diaminopimelate desuccinylase-like protein